MQRGKNQNHEILKYARRIMQINRTVHSHFRVTINKNIKLHVSSKKFMWYKCTLTVMQCQIERGKTNYAVFKDAA